MPYTPGPWTTDEREHNDPYQHVRIVGGGRAIAELWIDDAPVPEYNAEQYANARLIASAPELGAALNDLVRELILSDVPLPYIDSHFRPWIDKAKAALTKAGVRP